MVHMIMVQSTHLNNFFPLPHTLCFSISMLSVREGRAKCSLKQRFLHRMGPPRPPSTFWVRFPSPLISKKISGGGIAEKSTWREGGREGSEVHSSTTRARIPKIRSRGNRTKVGGGLGLIWLIRRARIRYSNRYLLKAVGIELLMGFMLPSVRIPGCVNPHRCSAHVHVRVIDLGGKDSYDPL